MLKRILVGIPLAVSTVLFLTFFRKFSPYITDILIFFYLASGTFEIVKSLKTKSDYKIIILPICLYIILIWPLIGLFNYYNIATEIAILILLITLSVIMLLIFTFKNKYEMKDLMASLFVLIYPISIFSLLFVMNHQVGNLIALFFVAFVAVLTDLFAYAFGISIKGPKLCPSISPKKTISGFVGGLFGGLCAGTLIFLLFDFSKKASYLVFKNEMSVLFKDNITLSVCIYLLIGLLASLISQAGDLVASRIKRNLKIKDFGTIFPGHGGILDRIDSFIFVTPIIYLIMKVITLCK